MKNSWFRKTLLFAIIANVLVCVLYWLINTINRADTPEDAFRKRCGEDCDVIATCVIDGNTYVVANHSGTIYAGLIGSNDQGYFVKKVFTQTTLAFSEEPSVSCDYIRISNDADAPEILVVTKRDDNGVPMDTNGAEFSCIEYELVGGAYTQYYFWTVTDVDTDDYAVTS